MIVIGKRGDYLEAARVECDGMTRDELLSRVAYYFRKSDTQTNEATALRQSYDLLYRASRHLEPLFRQEPIIK